MIAKRKSFLTIATRKSPLALIQANEVKNLLQSAAPHLSIQFLELTTMGDKRTDVELTQIGGKSLFVKELQNALLNHEADIAVHSVKDMSAAATSGLQLAAVCQRQDPRDVFISNHVAAWQDLPSQAIVGTASPRRQCQILAKRPDLLIKPIRGNVGSRLAKLANSEYDAIILAAAGLNRLKLGEIITQFFSVQELIPAIGQGALGIECRDDDFETQSLVKPIDHWHSHLCIQAERAVNFRLGGDCYTPIGAYATITAQTLTLEAMVGNPNGQVIIRDSIKGPMLQAQQLGVELAEKLLANGAGSLLNL